MISLVAPRCSAGANAVYGLLNPIPFGCFVAALIFDITCANSAVILWDKGASWLITLGLLFAVIPRIHKLVQVWITGRQLALRAEKIDCLLNLPTIIAAIFNAFGQTRDAHAVIPAGVWLSLCTVLLIAIGNIIMAAPHLVAAGDLNHEPVHWSHHPGLGHCRHLGWLQRQGQV
jgi:uncharacterized membrane protein